MEHPDEGTIHAWLDAALPADEAAALESHITTCAACAASVAEARGFVAAASRIVSSLDDVPSGVIPAATAPRRQHASRPSSSRQSSSRPWWARPRLAAAALLMVVAGSVYTLSDRPLITELASDLAMDSAVSGPSMSAPGGASAGNASVGSAGAASAATSAAAEAAAPPVSRAAQVRQQAVTDPPVDASARAAAPVAPPTAAMPLSARMSAPPPPAADAQRSGNVAGAMSKSAAAAAPSPAAFSSTTPGCYATNVSGQPKYLRLSDSIATRGSLRIWYAAHAYPPVRDGGTIWQWAPVDAGATDVRRITGNDTTRFRISTARTDSLGCR